MKTCTARYQKAKWKFSSQLCERHSTTERQSTRWFSSLSSRNNLNMVRGFVSLAYTCAKQGFMHGTQFQQKMQDLSRLLELVLKRFNMRHQIWTIGKRVTHTGYIFTCSIKYSLVSTACKPQPAPKAFKLAPTLSCCLHMTRYAPNYQRFQVPLQAPQSGSALTKA